jgi:hypothetical protein
MAGKPLQTVLAPSSILDVGQAQVELQANCIDFACAAAAGV